MSWTTKHTWQMLTWGFMCFVALDLLVINWAEQTHAHDYDVENPFSGTGVFEQLNWLLTFAVTGFNQNMFPNSMIAKVSAVLIPIVAVLGAFAGLIYTSLEQTRRHEKLRRGEEVPELKNHVLICGWNDRVPEIVRNLLSRYAPDYKHCKILIIADIDEDKPLDKYGIKDRSVYFYRGISSSYDTLQACSFEKCRVAIVVADDKKVAAGNFRSVFTIAAINKLRKNQNKCPIVAEAFYQSNVPYFIGNGVRRLVCLTSYRERLLSHAVVNPGASDLLINLLAFEPPYKLQSNIATDLDVENKSFTQAALQMREKGKLLLSCYKSSLNTLHDALEMEFRKDESPYLVNLNSQEQGTYIDCDDRIIFLETVSDQVNFETTYLQHKSFKSVDSNMESILIIGYSESSCVLANDLSGRVKNIVCMLDDALECKKLASSIKLYKFSRLEDVLVKAANELININRIVITSPDLVKRSYSRSVYQDDEVLKSVTILQHFYRRTLQREIPHIACEIRDLGNKELFYSSGVSQIIPTNRLIELVLTRMVYHVGLVSGFVIKAMSYSVSNKVARIEKNQVVVFRDIFNLELAGKVFDVVFKECLSKEILLIAIEKTTDEKKEVIVNPKPMSEHSLKRISPEDSLYTIFTGQALIKMGFL